MEVHCRKPACRPASAPGAQGQHVRIEAFPPLAGSPLVRNLLIFILVLFGIWWARGAVRRFKAHGGFGRKSAGGKPAAPERMLECRQCGLIVPESEGVRGGDDFYCCDEHRRAGHRSD